jgi:hemerythrin-like domain-containing protein
MTAVEQLKQEHRLIQSVLGEAQRQVQAFRERGRLDAGKIARMVDFFQTFVESCHNAKEEDHLFPRMAARGPLTVKGQIAMLLQEHADGRELVQAVAADLPGARQGDPAALEAVADHLSFYAEALQAHLDKEDTGLLALADRVLNPRDQEDLLQAFEQHEAQGVGAGVHEKYLRLAHELAQDA